MLRIVVCAALLAAAVGCSSKSDSDPKPVNVKDDPRIKPMGGGGNSAGGPGGAKTNTPAK